MSVNTRQAIREEIIEPDRPIIDAHHHLNDRHDRMYLAPEFLADAHDGHNIVASVYIENEWALRENGPESLRCVGETEAAEAVAQAAADAGETVALCAAIIPAAELILGAAVDEVLEAHQAAAPTRFRGIRDRLAHDEGIILPPAARTTPAGRAADAKFREGLACLAKRGLTFESWAFHKQIPEVTDLARACPDVTIIMNHLGGPMGVGPYKGKLDEVFAQWKPDIEEAASCPNIMMKLGGNAMPLNGFDWHQRDVEPSSQEVAETVGHWYHHAIEAFGPDRCMFESNYPVDGDSFSYRTLWNVMKRIAAPYGEDEKDAMCRGTAARVYRIEL